MPEITRLTPMSDLIRLLMMSCVMVLCLVGIVCVSILSQGSEMEFFSIKSVALTFAGIMFLVGLFWAILDVRSGV